MKESNASSSQLPHYTGHRHRLKEKFLKGSLLEDYELLELLLFYAIPRADVKPLAKDLVKQFSTFGQLLSSDPSLLKEIKGVGDHVILLLKVVEALKNRLLQQELTGRSKIQNTGDVVQYCQQAIGQGMTEKLMVLFLDNQNGIIRDEVMYEGTVDAAPIYPREILKRALEVSASSIILVHNHPGGDPTPSTNDILMTEELCRASEALGITLHDHIIVAAQDHRSLRALGVM